ncbi:unnamed protein product [Fraxinus pennsylvanica]|uniref:Uncharacterized protein n=1 Tax=Fraxinus pennsylvanica TaxID=56036 RepID=A0AAD1ZS35_9LAMI|nr:unnamed protein product [Fraxinus pennsylvanica]
MEVWQQPVPEQSPSRTLSSDEQVETHTLVELRPSVSAIIAMSSHPTTLNLFISEKLKYLTSRCPSLRKGLGGLKEVLQLISNNGSMEQPVPKPMPKGYGTVRFAHLLGHLGLVMFAPFVIVVGVRVVLTLSEAANANGRHKRSKRTERRSMFEVEI